MKMIKQPTIPPMPKQPTFDARDTQYNLPIGKDLISRTAAQTELQLSARRYTVAHEAHGEGRVVWSEDLISVSDAMNVLRKLPSAQPKRGKWIKSGRWGRVYKCNQCRNYLDFDGVNAGRGDANFCPNCGAKMRGEQDG